MVYLQKNFISKIDFTDPEAFLAVIGPVYLNVFLFSLLGLFVQSLLIATYYSYIEVYVKKGKGNFDFSDITPYLFSNGLMAIGASIVILSLLAGLAAILSGKLSINRFLRNDDFLMYLIISALPVVAIFDGQLTRLYGLWLIGAYLLFIGRMYQRRNIYEKHLSADKVKERIL